MSIQDQVENIQVGGIAHSIAVSPDGKKVYVPLYETGQIAVFNAETNVLSASINVGANPRKVIFNKNGTRAYITNEGFITVINVSNNSIFSTIPSDYYNENIALSPDETRLYVTVTFVDTGIEVYFFLKAFNVSEGTPGYGEQTTIVMYQSIGGLDVAVSPNGNKLYVTNYDQQFTEIIDASSFEVINRIDTERNKPLDIKCAINGKVYCLININENDLKLHVMNENETNWEIIQEGGLPVTGGFAVSDDGTRIWAGNRESKTISLINTATYHIIDDTININVNPRIIKFNALKNELWGFSDENDSFYLTKIYRKEQTTNVPFYKTTNIPISGFSHDIKASPDGSKLYVPVDGGGLIVINADTNEVSEPINVGSFPIFAIFNKSGTRAFISCYYGDNITVMDGLNDSVLYNINSPGINYGMALSPDGTRLYATIFDYNIVRVFNVSEELEGTEEYGTIIAEIPVGDGPIEIDISPDGNKLYVAAFYGEQLNIISTSTFDIIRTLYTFGSRQIRVRCSIDGKVYCLVHLYNIAIRVFVLNAAETSMDIIFNEGIQIDEFAISDDGKNLWAINWQYNNTVSEFNTENWQLINTLNKSILNLNYYYPVKIAFSKKNIWTLTYSNEAYYITKLYTTRSGIIPCFKSDTKILTSDGYRPIQHLRKGDLIKTLRHGYVPIHLIGSKQINHTVSKERLKNQLYKLSREQYPEVFEDLILTGCHSILVDKFKNDEQMEKTKQINDGIYVTDKKYRVPAVADEKASVYEVPGTHTIYHFALEHADSYMNYGVYANGLLVETCSKCVMKKLSVMQLID